MSRPRPEKSSSWRGDEAGSVTVELLILLPALFAVLFLGMQAALYQHARTVAIAAAQEGARAAGAQHGRAADGAAAAAAFVRQAGGEDVILHAQATADRSATTATVTLEGASLSVLPGWSPRIRQSATVPVERITAP